MAEAALFRHTAAVKLFASEAFGACEVLHKTVLFNLILFAVIINTYGAKRRLSGSNRHKRRRIPGLFRRLLRL